MREQDVGTHPMEQEGSTARHCLMFAEGMQWIAQRRNVECTSEEDGLAIEADDGSAFAADWYP